jgi:hypothetical protein
MAHRSWYFGDSFDSSFDDEIRQALEKQPYFMLECSKIQGAKFVKEITKKDLIDITTDGFMYFIEEEQKFFILDKQCAYLLGVFDLQKRRIYQKEFDEIKEKSSIYMKYNDEFKKIDACVTYQKIVQSFISSDSDEYKKSNELLTIFKEKFCELKQLKDDLKKNIEELILQYILKELDILPSESTGINIKGTQKHYLEYFIY